MFVGFIVLIDKYGHNEEWNQGIPQPLFCTKQLAKHKNRKEIYLEHLNLIRGF